MTQGEPCLVWTRSREDWPADEPLLRACGLPVVHIPCLRLQALPVSTLQLPQIPRIYVFTSAHAVRYALKHPQLNEDLDAGNYAVFVVGEATQQVLRECGIASTLPKGVKDGASLARFLTEKLEPGTCVVLPGAEKRAFPMAQALSAAGFACLNQDLYRSEVGYFSDENLTDRHGVVCFASPSAVRGFCTRDREQFARNFSAVALGATTASAARAYFSQVSVAPEPTLASLVRAATMESRTPFLD